MIGKGAYEIRQRPFPKYENPREKARVPPASSALSSRPSLGLCQAVCHLKLSDAQEMQTELEKLGLKSPKQR